MDTKKNTAVEKLVEKAANAENAASSVGFSQAACNVAHAMRVLFDIDEIERARSRDPGRGVSGAQGARSSNPRASHKTSGERTQVSGHLKD